MEPMGRGFIKGLQGLQVERLAGAIQGFCLWSLLKGLG